MREQIEGKHALSESIYMSGHGLDWKDSDDIAEQLYNEGYRKQSDGEWIEHHEYGTMNQSLQCSVCNWKTVFVVMGKKDYKFCPNCAAKMKGE